MASRSFATACVLAVLLAGCLLAAAADARRLLHDDGTAPAMPPAPMPYAVGYYDGGMSPALAPSPESGADDLAAGRMLFRGRGLLDTGLTLAGRLLLGLGL